MSTEKKIVDCFLFYNELDMLQYRLEVLDAFVDYFVLVESTHTFSGREKPLYYNENKDLFAKYEKKLIFIMVHDMPYKFPRKKEAWLNEAYQRNCLSHGIDSLRLQDNDVILLSDVDEIPDLEMLEKIRKDEIKFDFACLEQDLYYYNLQTKLKIKWYFSKAINYKTYKEKNIPLHDLRMNTTCLFLIPKGGWHLSYFCDEEHIKSKIMDFSHQEFNQNEFTNVDKIAERIKNGTDLFDRAEIKMTTVLIEDNTYLPPSYAKLIALIKY
jgi:beta-1,4-mannosyl-glycoprotein beta-1,4-N-acetylglucosaminyltransferase